MPKKVGMIGCGNIAPQYVTGLSMFPEDITLAACADLVAEKAQAFAQANGIEALSVDDLLVRDDIEIIINLTTPNVHHETCLRVLNAGKHVYTEKPLALKREDGRSVVDIAASKGLRVGCAPDTFLGSGGQTSRAAIDEGRIGRPVSATAFMAGHGPEAWHPNPGFFYLDGGGPMLDMGPYYLTALVNLLGPIKGIAAFTSRAFDERVANHEAIRGQRLPVTVSTHYAGTIEFVSGAIATLITSFDTWRHHLPNIEIHGTEGSMSVPDPNTFGGTVSVWTPQTQAWEAVSPRPGAEYLRGVGVADMARSINRGEPHRASGALGLHVLDVMLAFDESSRARRVIELSTTVDRPAVWVP